MELAASYAASVSMVADASVKSGLMSSVMEDLSALASDSIFSILRVIASLAFERLECTSLKCFCSESNTGSLERTISLLSHERQIGLVCALGPKAFRLNERKTHRRIKDHRRGYTSNLEKCSLFFWE